MSVQFPQQFGEIAVARLGRRGLEGTAQRGHHSSVRRRHFHPDDPAVHGVQSGHCNTFSLQLHRHCKRAKARGSFLQMRLVRAKWGR